MSDSSNSPRCLSSHKAIKQLKTDIPTDATLAERIAYEVAHPDDWHFIHTILRLYPSRLSCALARRYVAIHTSTNRFNANTDLRAWVQVAKECGIALTADFNRIQEIADDRSRNALTAQRWGGSSESGQYRSVAQYVRNAGIEPIEPNDETPSGTVTQSGCIKRMTNKNWWSRQLRKKLQRERERITMKIGLVCKQKDIYCSREALSDNQAQQAKNQALLENMVATDGEVSISLADIAKSNVSNPEVRHAELMTRLKGFEHLINENGQEAIFVTVTCPSRMHSILSKAKIGTRNPKYDGTTPDKAHKYLQKTWQQCRAKLNRENIPLEGMRIAEPHHDGCPHWHLALSTDPERKHDLIDIITHYFTREDSDEKGIENRVKVEFVRSIAGYLSKYISKNIDGKHVDKDFHGKDAKTSAESVRAWASLWGIRQFQPIGGASVTVYRELRRIREKSEVPASMLDIWNAADSGDWAEYERLQGGLNTPKSTHKVQLAKAWSDKPNQFGEATGNIIVGVFAANDYLDTRPKTWTIGAKKDSLDINQLIADAIGTNHTAALYSGYCAQFKTGNLSEIEPEENAIFEASVQLFTQGQVALDSLGVAPTGAQKTNQNDPPDYISHPPFDEYAYEYDPSEPHQEHSALDLWDQYETLAETEKAPQTSIQAA